MIQGFAINQGGGSGTGGGPASVLFSAGTLSAVRSDVTFANSNGVSFGLNGAGVITATVATNYLTTAMASNRGSDFVQATAAFAGTNASGTINSTGISVSVAGSVQGSINFSAGTTSSNIASVTFSNANGVSFGLGTGANAGVITGTVATNYAGTNFATTTAAGSVIAGTMNTSGLTLGVPAFLTTAALSQDSSKYAGTGFTTATTAGTAIVGTHGTNGLSMGVPAFLTTAMQSNAATISNSNISAGTTSTNASAFTFANANNVSFGLGTGASAGSITASIATTYAGTGFTTATTAGTAIVGTLNTSGLSMGVPAFLTTAALSSQTLAFTLGGNIATTNSSQILNGGYILAGGNNITIQQSNNSISISAASVAPSPVNFSAGTTSNNLGSVIFSNSNSVTFGLGSGTASNIITASFSAAAGGVAISNSQTLFSTGTVNLLEGGGAITIASSAGGQSLKFSVPQTSSIVGTNGISVVTNVSTISVSLIGTTGSYFANLAVFENSTTTMAQSNSFYVFPISLPFNVSASYLRLLASFNFTSTSIATSAVNNATGASTAFSETVAFNAVLYTVGTGASSRSLMEMYSTSAGLTWAASVSQASTSNATNQSFTQRITFPSEGFTTATTSTQYSVSATNGPISTTQWSNLSANKFLDIPFATSISAGVYWMALNRISGTVGGKNMDVNASTYGNSQQNFTFGNLNVASNLSNAAPQIGLGLWTTNAAQTTSSIAFASISATTSYMVPFVQLINQA